MWSGSRQLYVLRFQMWPVLWVRVILAGLIFHSVVVCRKSSTAAPLVYKAVQNGYLTR